MASGLSHDHRQDLGCNLKTCDTLMWKLLLSLQSLMQFCHIRDFATLGCPRFCTQSRTAFSQEEEGFVAGRAKELKYSLDPINAQRIQKVTRRGLRLELWHTAG